MTYNQLIEKLPEWLQIKLIKMLFSGERKIAFYQRLKDGDQSEQQTTETLQIMLRLYEKNDKFEAFIVKKALGKRFHGRRDYTLFSDWIDGIESIILKTSEQTTLHEALERCINLETRRSEIKKVLLSEMWGPIMRIGLIIGLMCFMGTSVLPELLASSEYDISNGNIFTQILFVMMNFVNSIWGVISLIGFIGLIVFIFGSLPKWTGTIRERFDRFPPWSSYRIMTGAAWLSSVSVMISSGISVRQALEETMNMAAKNNAWLHERIEAILVKYGSQSFGKAVVDSGYMFPDKELIDEMEIYAEQNVPNERYVQLADKWASKGVDSMRKQIAIISGLSMAIFYGMSILFVLGIFMFTQDIANSATM